MLVLESRMLLNTVEMLDQQASYPIVHSIARFVNTILLEIVLTRNKRILVRVPAFVATRSTYQSFFHLQQDILCT